MKRLFAAAVAAGLLLGGAPASAQDKLTVWWVKGFYKSEDDALFEAVQEVRAEERGQGRAVAIRRRRT